MLEVLEVVRFRGACEHVKSVHVRERVVGAEEALPRDPRPLWKTLAVSCGELRALGFNDLFEVILSFPAQCSRFWSWACRRGELLRRPPLL